MGVRSASLTPENLRVLGGKRWCADQNLLVVGELAAIRGDEAGLDEVAELCGAPVFDDAHCQSPALGMVSRLSPLGGSRC